MNILVTGGAGYIGSHACRALADAGFLPVTLDNLCLGTAKAVRWGPLVEADIRNSDAVLFALRQYDIAGVMHFAAFAQVGESVADPAKYYDNNVLGTLALLNAMRQTDVRKILFSSSCAVYGAPTELPISERTLPQPVNPYGQTKLVCEHMLRDFQTYGFQQIALRYFNAAGATPEAGLGEPAANAVRLIPRAVLARLGRMRDFVVNGQDFPTADGTAVRDYIHVKDLAVAHVIAMRRLLDDRDLSGCFNLGTGIGFSIQQVLAAIEEVTGAPVAASIGPRRAGDPSMLYADATLARDVLGFVPTQSDLATIVRDTWHWYSSV